MRADVCCAQYVRGLCEVSIESLRTACMHIYMHTPHAALSSQRTPRIDTVRQTRTEHSSVYRDGKLKRVVRNRVHHHRRLATEPHRHTATVRRRRRPKKDQPPPTTSFNSMPTRVRVSLCVCVWAIELFTFLWPAHICVCVCVLLFPAKGSETRIPNRPND